MYYFEAVIKSTTNTFLVIVNEPVYFKKDIYRASFPQFKTVISTIKSKPK